MSTIVKVALSFALAACVNSQQVVVAAPQETPSSATPRSTSITEQAASKILTDFLAAGTADKYKMLSASYRKKLEGGEYLEGLFSKESFELARIHEMQQEVRKDGTPAVYVRAQVTWGFEGFEGDQTCHFVLGRVSQKWWIEYVLC